MAVAALARQVAPPKGQSSAIVVVSTSLQLPTGKPAYDSATISRARLDDDASGRLDETVVTRNQAGSIDLGTPRTLWIGIRFGG